MSIKLDGNWYKGLAFDVHTLSSTYLGPNEYGHDQWENERSEIGELLYRLKYRDDRGATKKIVKLLEKIKGIEAMDCVIPMPSTNTSRNVQPVSEIAHALGKRRKVPVLEGILLKRVGGPELKNVEDVERRKEILRERLFIADDQKHKVAGKNVLIIDDLYRSGATLTVSTDLLYEAGANRVNVLTMTKTRSNR